MHTLKSFHIKTILFGIVCWTQTAEAQIDYSDFITSGEHDAYYKPAVRERQPVALTHLREADVAYSHRVVRCIDARQKMNKALEWPRQPLSRVLFTALWEGSLTPYKNDSLHCFYNTTDFHRRCGYEVQGSVSDDPDDPDNSRDTLYWAYLEHSSIRKYWVLEDWIFDAKHSVFKPRIIAIAPIFRPQFANGITGPEQPLCWIPMDDKLRNMMARTEMFNRYNQAARMNYDDFFQMRMFDSYILFESNVFDQFIAHFEQFENDAEGALLEGERIRNDLFVFEHDLWQF